MIVVDSESTPQIGQVVRILRGRDKDKLAIVVGLENHRFVWLADGDKRKFDSPKKKNINHIQQYDYISREVEQSIMEIGRVTNGKLRFAVNKFQEQVDTDIQKGE